DYRMCIRSGDIIARIEGKPTDGLSVEDIVGKLRGPRGTTVHISVQREGIPELFEFSIVREEIPHHSIPFTFFIRHKVGYLRFDSFTETTESELEQSLKRLGSDLEGLVQDLNNNPGGSFDAAV